ncbi:MAG TPA: hypothetical protein VHQ70_01795 [Syntrophomonadaceae bacterium]|nr:hypothetical protein [Syntrophomonadaceae bacterium]
MYNIYMLLRDDIDSTVALAVTRFYMDYYKKDLRPVRIYDPDDLPWQEVSADTRIYVIGFTPKYEVFHRLANNAGDIIWIDNNAASVEKIYEKSSKDLNFRKIKGKRAGNLSLCELTWDSYFAWVRKQPEIINLVGRYTMFDREHLDWNSRIVPFNSGLKLQDINPFDNTVFEGFWKKILCLKRDLDVEQEVINTIIGKGKGGVMK